MNFPGAPGRAASATTPLRPGAARATAQPGPDPARTGRRITLALLAILGAVNAVGLPYYTLPSAARVRSPFHPWLKPTGYVGQTAGFLSMALFLFLWLYPLRKKIRWLAFTGSLGRWLDVHVVAGICIPFLAAIHAAWHFTGVIGLGYGAMLVVCLSGIIGKYLYARIPRSRSGLELSLGEVNGERTALQGYIADTTGVAPEVVDRLLSVDTSPYTGLGPLRTMWRMMRDDFDRFRAARKLRRGLRGAMRGGRPVDREVIALVLKLARRQMALSQQVRMLDATQRVFRYWHVAHRPVAVTALLAVMVHVVTAVALGVTWLH
jgi:hypothetical protein